MKSRHFLEESGYLSSNSNDLTLVYRASLDELIDDIHCDELQEQSFGSSSRKSSKTYDWDLRCGWDGSLKFLDKGWTERSKELEELADKFELNYELDKPIFQKRDSGDEVLVSDFLEGEPEHWISFNEAPVRQMTLLVRIDYNCSIDAESAFWRGGAIYALVRALERAGITVEIKTISVVDSDPLDSDIGYYRHLIDITIKKSQDYLDPARLAYFLAHPAFFRRNLFNVFEIAGKDDQKHTRVNRGYGRTSDNFKYQEYDMGQQVVYIQRLDDNFYSKDDAIQLVLKQFAEQGVEFN